MTGSGQFDTLVIHLAAEGSGGQLDIGQQIIARSREQRVIAAVVPEIEHHSTHSGPLDSSGRRRPVVERGQELVVVTHADIGVDGTKESSRADATAVFLADKGNLLAPQSGRIQEHIHVFAEQFRHGVEKVGAAGFERLDCPQPGLMRQTKRVFLIEFKTAAQQFITAVAKQKTEIERLALLDLVGHIARGVVHGFVSDAHGLECPEPREPVAAVLHLNPVQIFGCLQLHAAFQDGPFRPPVACKSNLAQLDFRPRLNLSPKVNEDIRCVRLPPDRGNLDRHVRKTLSILIGAQALNKVLQPQKRIRRLRLYTAGAAGVGVILRVDLDRHRADEGLPALLDRNVHTDGPRGIVSLQPRHGHQRVFKAFPRERFFQVADRPVEPRRGVDTGALQRHQETGLNK